MTSIPEEVPNGTCKYTVQEKEERGNVTSSWFYETNSNTQGPLSESSQIAPRQGRFGSIVIFPSFGFVLIILCHHASHHEFMADLHISSQIGIHGLPYIEWQNGGPYRATGWAGYCPHGVSIKRLAHQSKLIKTDLSPGKHFSVLAPTFCPALRAIARCRGKGNRRDVS